MRVLYVSHTSAVSGAERSLLELLARLASEIDPVVACPIGPASELFRDQGLPVLAIPELGATLKVDSANLRRVGAEIATAAGALRSITHRTKPDLVHANSVRAGLQAIAAAIVGGPRPVVHVRDCLPDGRLTTATRWLTIAGARGVLANSRYTAARFWPRAPERVVVVDNPIGLERLATTPAARAAVRQELGLEAGRPVLSLIAQITPWKGQDDAVRMLARVRHSFPEAVLLLVGDPKFLTTRSRFDNAAFSTALDGLAHELGVAEGVLRLGERADVGALLEISDLVLVPSWEEPFGRSVAEGMMAGRCVLATSVGGPREIIRDGVDGRLLPPRQPEVWSTAIVELLRDRDLRARLGVAGAVAARSRFSSATVAANMIEIYRRWST